MQRQLELANKKSKWVQSIKVRGKSQDNIKGDNMRIAILGAGAMGLLFGGYLSRENEVYLLCRGEEKINKINNEGLKIEEADGKTSTFYPIAVPVGSTDVPTLDVLILFVKTGASKDALEENKHLISENTILMTLQNGSGHEQLLKNYADEKQIAIGVSLDGSFLAGKNEIRHTGSNATYFGMLSGEENETLSQLEKTFNTCGFETYLSDKVKHFVWEKLIINTASSVLSGILGMPQGYVYQNKSTWEIIKALVSETVAVAAADGIMLDYKTQLKRVETLVTTNPEGIPSITVDLKEGRKTEVDSISGSVVYYGKKYQIPTPTHNMAVNLVHAMEEKPSK